jgi:hypothetical protein
LNCLRSISALSVAPALLFAAATAFAQTDGVAKLVSFSGRISVLRDSTEWALNTGDTVRPQQVIVTGSDGWGLFSVADGSKFEVYQNSRVVFRANRGDWKDLLEVWLGKVRVQIEHIGNLPNNNRVRTPSAVVSVRGTVFDVEVDDETETTLVLDEEGIVEVSHLLKPGPSRILTAGEWVRIYKNEPVAKAKLDGGGIMQRAIRVAADLAYQAAVNARQAATVASSGGGTGSTVGAIGSPGDTNNTTAPPPPPPPPAPPVAPPPAPGKP